MTADELKDICLCGETTKVQFKEAPIPQKELAREMIAFANSKGGVMLFGVADKTGDNEESANQFKVTVWRTIQKKVLEYFRNHPTGTRAEAAIAVAVSVTL